MFSRIVVPLDGSARAEHAVPVAAKLARACHGSVILMRVLDSTSYGGYAAPVPLTDVALDEAQGEDVTYLRGIAQSDMLHGITTSIITESGIPASAILDCVDKERADLIIMCSHGRTGLARWALGSVTQSVARQSRVPVLVLREHGPQPAPLVGQQMRALIPVDGSALSEAAAPVALQLALALAGEGRVEAHLVRVVTPVTAVEDGEARALNYGGPLREARAYLVALSERLRASVGDPATLTIRCEALFGTDVAGELVALAGHSEGGTGYDLLAMATHGRGGLRRLVVGSVTERALSATRLPLLIVRPRIAAGPETVVEPTGAVADDTSAPGN